jgi:hypothetical protein
MLLSQMPSIRWFALLCDVAMVAALVGVVVVLPALLVCFGPGKPLTQECRTAEFEMHRIAPADGLPFSALLSEERIERALARCRRRQK